MHFDIITLFPEMFDALNVGVTGRAIKNKNVSVKTWQLRDFTEDPYRRVDDRPYGGGPGMVLMAEPLKLAIKAAKENEPKAKVIYCSPTGRQLTQKALIEMSQETKLIFLAGRYEGIDERIIETEVDEEWSLGDYVISGGEIAVMTMIDGITRLLPGVLNNEESAKQDSFMEGMLDYPHYTRPETILGKSVPEVLLSGDHQAIESWREKQALEQTFLRRPDLIEKMNLNAKQREWLNAFIEKQRGAEKK